MTLFTKRVYHQGMTNVLLQRDGKYVKDDSLSLLHLPTDQRVWVQLTNPKEIEVKRVIDELSIPEDFVRSALDDEEGPRLDLDDDTGYRLIVFDIPVTQSQTEDSDAPYTTMPLSIIQKGNLTVSVCLNDSSKFNDIKHGTLRSNVLLDSPKILYQFLLAFHSLYEIYLRAIDKASTNIESKLLRNSNTDNILVEFMKLKNALIYFASSLRQNILVVDKLLAQRTNLTEDDIETLENIQVEIKQAFATCTLQRELMNETMDTYANIVNNRLAERMRFLTIVTIILAIPTLIAGIYGMNLDNLPLARMGGFWSFIVICAIIVVVCVLVLLWLVPSHRKYCNQKKPKRRKHK